MDFIVPIQTLEQFNLYPVLDEKMIYKLIGQIKIKEDGDRESFKVSRSLIYLLFFY